MAQILIGTSGWHYDSWRGPFFPKGLPIKHQLQFYASQFATTELNGVFYRTPTPESVTAWREQTGNDFVFAWKASKFITHWKRLSPNSVNSLELLEDRLSLLGGKAGPILFQLPPHFQANADRLASFFKLLSNKRRSSRCAGAMEAHRRLRLCPGAWSAGAIQRALQRGRTGAMGQANEVLEE